MACENSFARIGVTKEEARARVKEVFETIFFDPEENFFHQLSSTSACMVDTGNIDARTEGMSYGMMMAVQMDRKDIFDQLWTFSMEHMHLDHGPNAGYFAWSVQLDGRHNAEGPAPDGEEYFAMALFMASARWGEGEGIFAYSHWARDILRHGVHQAEMVPGGQPMWNPETKYIKFVPNMDITDPSYHLPHFYELFAHLAAEEDRPFWREAAENSRKYIVLSAHPQTGLSPEYAKEDGTPVLLFGKPWPYYSDAYRVAMNIALDTIWNGHRLEYERIATNLQDFLATQLPEENFRACELDGTRSEEPAMHPIAMLATCAAASVASRSNTADMWLRRFWQTPLRRGKRRYYDNCLYFFCLLMLAGEYKQIV